MVKHLWKPGVLTGAIILSLWAYSVQDMDNGTVSRIVLVYAMAVSMLLLDSIPAMLKGERLGYFILILGSWFYFAYPAAEVILTPGVWFTDRIHFLTNETLILAVIYTGLFLLISITIYWLFNGFAHTTPPEENPKVEPDQLLIPLMTFSILVALPYLLLGGGLEQTIQGILASRSGLATKGWKQATLGDEISPIWVFSRPTLVALSAISFLLLVIYGRNLSRRWIYAGVLALSLFVVFFDTGTRSWFLLAVVPPTLVILRGKLTQFSLGKLLLGMLLALLIFSAAQFQLQYRTVGNLSALEISPGDVLSIGDNDFFSETAAAIAIVSGSGHVQENTLLLFLSNPIPRFLWPEKPYPETVDAYSLVRRGSTLFAAKGNSMPSIVGQFYMSGGIWGVIAIGLFYGGFYGFLDRKWNQYAKQIFWSLVCTTAMIWLWISHRGLYPGFHYAVVIEIVIIGWASRVAITQQNMTGNRAPLPSVMPRAEV